MRFTIWQGIVIFGAAFALLAFGSMQHGSKQLDKISDCGPQPPLLCVGGLALTCVDTQWECAGAVASAGYLEGVVEIGPTCPLISPSMPCEVSPQTYTTREVVAYSEGEIPGGPGLEILTSGPIYRVNLEADGSYRIELPEGIYLIHHGRLGVDSSSTLPKEVQIRGDEVTTLNFDIDTGIR